MKKSETSVNMTTILIANRIKKLTARYITCQKTVKSLDSGTLPYKNIHIEILKNEMRMINEELLFIKSIYPDFNKTQSDVRASILTK